MRSGGVIQPDVTRWNVLAVTMKAQEQLWTTITMSGNQGGFPVPVFLELSVAGHGVSATLCI